MDQLNKKRLKRAKFWGKIISYLPNTRCVILNGSLAKVKSKQSSDVDILIIAKTGRVFSSRFFVIAFASICRIKRSKDDNKSHAGKFCFNYFLTEDFLTIPTGRGEKMDRYCADNYSSSQFLAGEYRLYEKFMLKNKKLFGKYEHKISSFQRKLESRKSVMGFWIKSRMTQRIGDCFERWAKDYQIKKIESDPRTKKYPKLIVFNDQELRFHPPKSS